MLVNDKSILKMVVKKFNLEMHLLLECFHNIMINFKKKKKKNTTYCICKCNNKSRLHICQYCIKFTNTLCKNTFGSTIHLNQLGEALFFNSLF